MFYQSWGVFSHYFFRYSSWPFPSLLSWDFHYAHVGLRRDGPQGPESLFISLHSLVCFSLVFPSNRTIPTAVPPGLLILPSACSDTLLSPVSVPLLLLSTRWDMVLILTFSFWMSCRWTYLKQLMWSLCPVSPVPGRPRGQSYWWAFFCVWAILLAALQVSSLLLKTRHFKYKMATLKTRFFPLPGVCCHCCLVFLMLL